MLTLVATRTTRATPLPAETRLPYKIDAHPRRPSAGRNVRGWRYARDMGLTLTPDEVRRITLRSQGFLGAASRRGGIAGMLNRVGGVQLDTISVLARSHELVAYARLGPIGRDRIERAYWNPRKPTTFEYWAHAACILPIEEWPFYAFRRRAFRAKGLRWHKVSETACKQVLARLTADGPLTATELGGAKGGGPWWDWSE